ncbi:DNA polymerase domain-containing protein [Desertimonas flava]|uniref:DNA polymerase domain-containing protein n=1 Tax=Desertimonas flava TaxID=2064846 RepID=UPI000E344E76|nr:ATP-dependent DNA ligase [Desertimonas flava]
MGTDETRDGVELTNLDQPLFDGADAAKRDLVEYIDAVAERMIKVLADRPLSVVRVRPGQKPFMQKNTPKYAPDWIDRVDLWAETSKRTVSYAVANDRRTLIWFANQRAVEYHPTLAPTSAFDEPTHLVLDLDPPGADAFDMAVEVALAVREALAANDLDGAVKTSGSKGIHIFVPVEPGLGMDDAAAATRALAAHAAALVPDVATTAFLKDDREGKLFVDSTRVGWGTVVAAYSPRIRPGVPVSYPVAWEDLAGVVPSELTMRTVLERLGDDDPWERSMPPTQSLPAELIAEGHTIPVARVQAMHEGKRRRRAAKSGDK